MITLFFQVECIASTANFNLWNGIEIYILSLLKQETIGIIFNWDIAMRPPSPNLSVPKI